MPIRTARKKVSISIEENGDIGSESEYKEKPKNKDSWQFYLGYVGEIGFVIVVPIVLGLLIGSYLDTKYYWYPKATVTGLFIGLFISIINFIQTVMTLARKR